MQAVLKELPDHSRLWIYQTDRALTADEMGHALTELSAFLSSWAAHGNQLVGGAEFINPYVLIVAADEHCVPASGCSIDTLTRFITELGNKLNCDFFVRIKVTGMSHSQWKQYTFNEVSSISDLVIIDTTIQHLGEFRAKGLVSPADSGLSRIFS
jgi:hypothetical protein